MSFGKYVDKAKEKTAQAHDLIRPRARKARKNVSGHIVRRLKKGSR